MAEGRLGGKLTAEVKGASADQAWKLLDFCSLQKLVPVMESCTREDGIDGHPGCVRRCVGKPIPIDGGDPFIAFATEKLLAIDHEERTFRYELLDSNYGLQGYSAAMKVLDDGEEGCRIEWSFAGDSYGKWETVQGFEEALRAILGNMVEAIELAVAAGEV